MKINTKALSYTLAITWGGSILVVGLLNLIWPTYAGTFLGVVASFYPGYHATASLGQVFVGTVYGVVDGLIGGLVVGWLYNFLAAKSGN